jgi:NAD(P)-dependent dehydrogenase (short-subunit alcohol dehydrogenase family)
MTKLLTNKNAVIYGAGGAVGGAVARVIAKEGAKVFLTGRNLASVAATAKDIVAAGGAAEAAQVDALDENAVEEHIAAVVSKAGTIDVSFNAIGIPQTGIQGISIAELAVESFMTPIMAYMRSHFLTARTAARRMVEKRSGVILMHTPNPARMGIPLMGGMSSAWAAMEAFNRNLSAEFAAHGIRAVCIRSTGLPETHTIEVVYGLHAKAMGIPREQFSGFLESLTHRKRHNTLAEVADTAAFLVSDKASGMTGANREPFRRHDRRLALTLELPGDTN